MCSGGGGGGMEQQQQQPPAPQAPPQLARDEADALAACSYGAWYARFASLAAAPALVLPLPDAFVAFLLHASLALPDDSDALPRRIKPTEVVVEGVDYDPTDLYSDSSSSSSDDGTASTGSSSDDDEDEEEQAARWAERFPELHAALSDGLAELGGLVAPRTNWSSPTDALWLTSDSSLRCRSTDEVILLLKSSDRVVHDLELVQQMWQQQQPGSQEAPSSGAAAAAGGSSSDRQQQHQQHQQQAQLVLRRWTELRPEREFRCFVHNHRLVAVSQRDPSQHFPQLSGSQPGAGASLAAIQAQLQAFHARHIGSSFPLPDYAMDVHVPLASEGGRVRLLDFSPIAPSTQPLLFSWDELPYPHMRQGQAAAQDLDQQQQQQQDPQQQQQQQQQQQEQGVELRVVTSEGKILPGCRAATGMPLDMLGLQDGGLQDLLARVQQQQQQQAGAGAAAAPPAP